MIVSSLPILINESSLIQPLDQSHFIGMIICTESACLPSFTMVFVVDGYRFRADLAFEFGNLSGSKQISHLISLVDHRQ